MLTTEQLQGVIGNNAYTSDGDKLGRIGQVFLDAFWRAVGGWVTAALEWAAAHPWQAVLLALSCLAPLALRAVSRRMRRV